MKHVLLKNSIYYCGHYNHSESHQVIVRDCIKNFMRLSEITIQNKVKTVACRVKIKCIRYDNVGIQDGADGSKPVHVADIVADVIITPTNVPQGVLQLK